MTFRLSLTGPPPWGFRICGGRDFRRSLTVSKVREDSRAGDAGMQVGDVILEINGQDTGAMLNMEAQNKIKTSEHQLWLLIERVSFNYPVWRYGPVDPEELMRIKRRQVQPQQPRQSNTFRILQEGLERDSCQECMKITGMFSSVVCVSCCRTQVVKIRERRYRHVECYTCRDCGFSLMERGHFCVDEELYCGKHAQQRCQTANVIILVFSRSIS
uniref:PDZ and LIM domain protein 2 n=1 Tax=Sinocyclocheilus anshuiensis TaxID=1608454 RepID=A0A671SCW5_9TELE